MEKLTLYRVNKHLFLFDNEEEEGVIILHRQEHGGEEYLEVSHLEDIGEMTEERQEEIVDYLNNHLDLLENAPNA